MMNITRSGYLVTGISIFVLFWLSDCTRVEGIKIDPQKGDTEFVSADGTGGNNSRDNEFGAAEDGNDGTPSDSGANEGRTVEEGDIYRVLGGNLILNLNSYRGLQVIDFSDVSKPEVIGRARISGFPVEMYVVGTWAVVLLNNYQGYWGNRHDVNVDSYSGGLVVTVDIADPQNPVIRDSARVPGQILVSRLTRGGAKQALFVAANDWSQDETMTVVRSFAVNANGQLLRRSTIDLGGYVADIQATPQALLVAGYDWTAEDYHSVVSIIDISDPDGFMVQGARVATAGIVDNKTKMDLYKGVLRVASAGGWSGSNYNHLQTWNVRDIQNPVEVDHQVFAEQESLFATLFLGNKAFFVTYQRVDPFYTFYIDDQGHIEARSEFEVSGWNDFFKPVLDDTRLVGIGMNDEAGQTMSVSLYDITDLNNPEPLVARAQVNAENSWSEARWDDRAFSVLQNAVSVKNSAGGTETGMVLLPFSGWDSQRDTYIAAVQIFTFSDSSLTRRGIMEHGTWVRRSFQPDEGLTANLSEESLSLFDSTDPDSPSELGRVELAPNYMDFLVYGHYGARLKYNRDYYYWWWGSGSSLPGNQLQIVDLDDDPDTAEPVAVVELQSDAQVYKVGSLAVAVSMKWVRRSDDEYGYDTTIQVFDLTDPRNPVQTSTMTTDRLSPYYDWWWYGPGIDECFDCGWGYYGYGTQGAKAVGQTLVFPSTKYESELVGVDHVCNTYPADTSDECWQNDDGSTSCVMFTGSINCTSRDEGPQECTGSIKRCVTDDYKWHEWQCSDIDPDDVQTTTTCYDQERRNYWPRFSLDVLDLSDPHSPDLLARIDTPRENQAASILADGTDLYVSYSIAFDAPGDSRDYARYYFSRVDLSNPSVPVVHAGVNVPGDLIAVQDHGHTVFTRDYVWNDDKLESAVNKLHVENGIATLLARVGFHDRMVNQVLPDGAGHLLVSHRLAWYAQQAQDMDWSKVLETLSVFDARGDDLQLLSQVEIDNWAWLKDAKVGRAMYQVPGGILVVNLDDASSPFAQAFFSTFGWPQSMVIEGDHMVIPAGRYGIYRFNLNEFNLQEMDSQD